MLQVLVTNLVLKMSLFVKSDIMETTKDDILKKFGEHIRRLRVESGLSQDDIVLNSYKITKATISDIENGKRNLSFTTLIDLAKGMKRHPTELLNYDREIIEDIKE